MAGTGQGALDYTREASRELPGSIKQVADLLLVEGTGIEQLTMAQVAARAYTSKPTLVRFAKQAGYAGWRDFRRDFLEEMARVEEERRTRTNVDVNIPFEKGSSVDDVVSSLARIQRLAADEVERTIDRNSLAAAAKAVCSTRTVICLGAMQNARRNAIFASNLAMMGVTCHAPGSDEAPALVHCLREGDCVIATSYSGGLAHMPISLVPQAKDYGAKVVAITNSEHSTLATVADFALTFAPLERYHAKVAAFYSGACTSLVLDALFAACYSLRFDESSAYRDTLTNSIGPHMSSDFVAWPDIDLDSSSMTLA